MIFPDLENNDIPRRTLRKKPNNLKATREVSAYEKMLATRVANIKNIATISPKTIGLFLLNSPYPKSQIKIQNNRSLRHIFDLIPKLEIV